jgi:beta-glucosidase
VEHSNDYAVIGSALHLGWISPHPDSMNAALDAAKTADVAIVFAGEQLGEGMDKTQLGLPGNQDALIEAVAASNPHTVVVLNTSTPVAMPWLDKVDAVLEAWYPGQESGAGIASLLFGDADPAGRLPVTFPAAADQGPGAKPETYPGANGIAHFDEGIFVWYRFYDQHRQKPLFPFGFGLSYTNFRLGDLKLSLDGAAVNVSLIVKNVGSQPGSEVVQVYVGEPTEADEPPSQLKGFAKVTLQPGEQKQVEIAIPVKPLSAWDERIHAWHVSAGTYEFKVGESSRDFKLREELRMQAAAN